MLQSLQTMRGPKRGIEAFFFTLIGLAILRVVLQEVNDVPLVVVPIANVVMVFLFLCGPLLALCFAARDQWSPKLALQFFVGGLALQISCNLLVSHSFQHEGIPQQVINALGQVGLPMWCVGLGALLATLIKDRNIILPIAIFLAFLDMFLVFSPLGVTRIIIRKFPAALSTIAAQVPIASHETTGEKITPGALAGPADFLFLAMFLVALFRHNLRGRLTVLVVIPTLLAYMFLVRDLQLPLPALVPIGVVVLLVNWKEFQLTHDEKLATALVTVLGIGLFTWGMFQKPRVVRVGPSSPDPVRGQKAPQRWPAPNESDQYR